MTAPDRPSCPKCQQPMQPIGPEIGAARWWHCLCHARTYLMRAGWVVIRTGTAD